MKVLITTDWFDPVINGVVTSVHTLTKELEERGHEVRILTLSRNRRTHTEGRVYYVGSDGAGKIYPEARFRPPFFGEYIRELENWRPDIIHSQCEFSTFFAAKKIASDLHIPIIHTYHTIYEDYTHYFSLKKTSGEKVVRRFTKNLSRQVSGMIAPSEKIASILKGYQVECPVWVVPSGISLEQYGKYREERWREQIREMYLIKPETTVLLYVGRLAREKNIEELLYYEQKAKEKETVLMLVGDGPCKEALERQTEELGLEEHVIFTGMIPKEEVGKYYQAGDLFVSASISETQGMTYGEALAAGLPLLCRKDACLNGVVADGKGGWQYENRDMFLELLDKWKSKSREEKMNMQSEAMVAAEKFSSEHFGRKLWNIISLAGLSLCVLLAGWAWQSGHFQSVAALQDFIMKFGPAGMALFVLIQMIQVVFPILPGGMPCPKREKESDLLWTFHHGRFP